MVACFPDKMVDWRKVAATRRVSGRLELGGVGTSKSWASWPSKMVLGQELVSREGFSLLPIGGAGSLLPQGRALVRHRCTTDKYNSRHNRTVYYLVHITQLRLVSCFRSPSGWLDLWAGITRLWEVATQGEGARLTHVRGTFLLLPPSPLASWGPFCWPRWGQNKLEMLLLAIV